MVTVPLIRELYAHMEWADARVWRSALGTPAAADDIELRERLFHIHRTQQAFLEIWKGEKPSRSNAKELPLPGMLAWARPWYRNVAAYIDQLRDESLDRPQPVPWSKWYAEELGQIADTTTLGETLLQLALHTQYHRAQVNTHLRGLGARPPMVDYIAWLWTRRPAPDWPA